MKTVLAIFLMTCLQVAINPLCLCYGVQVSEEIALNTCCHAPAGTEPDPCPHCDQEQPIAATAPVKGDFKAEAPESSESFAFGAMRESNELPFFQRNVVRTDHAPLDSGRSETQALFQVFLI